MVAALSCKRDNEKELKNWLAELAVDFEKVN